jgi:hypothetical protein
VAGRRGQGDPLSEVLALASIHHSGEAADVGSGGCQFGASVRQQARFPGRKLDELAATLARGKTRRSKDRAAAETTAITVKPWIRRVAICRLDGGQPKDLRLT